MIHLPDNFLGPHTPLIVFGVMTGLGVYTCVGGLRDVWRGLRSLKWPRTPGKVLTDSLEVGSNGSAPTYRANVAYEYSVANRAFTGKRIFWGDQTRFPFKGSADFRVSVYQPGSDVQVFYDPRNPSRSVLEPGVDGLTWYFLAVGVIMTGAIVYFWITYAP